MAPGSESRACTHHCPYSIAGETSSTPGLLSSWKVSAELSGCEDNSTSRTGNLQSTSNRGNWWQQEQSHEREPSSGRGFLNCTCHN